MYADHERKLAMEIGTGANAKQRRMDETACVTLSVRQMAMQSNGGGLL
jgi:hypothetical protein